MPTTITCPDCGDIAEFDALRREATEFCPSCDFPLFWARPDGPHLVSLDSVDTSRRRLPGTAGRMTIGNRVCPACGEQNPFGITNCIRCDSLLDPPPPEPVIELPPPPPPVVIIEPQRNWWPWILGGVTAALLLILLIVWIW
jgi:hypothetical protein